MHQKLLLVDGTSMQSGGRNIEDTYHLRQDQLDSSLRFMDTDVRIETTSGGRSVELAFERLWDFPQMVATLAEVRQHAPNDMAVNQSALKSAIEHCPAEISDDGCFERGFGNRARTLSDRQAYHLSQMQIKADHFQTAIRPSMRNPAPSSMEIDATAKLYYVENIPFHGRYGEPLVGRSFGAENGREARFGKPIHSVVLSSLKSVCMAATEANRQRVIINNAYFFPPSNLVQTLANMLDGTLECQNVDIVIITNSRETTDLAIVNMFGRHIAFAFSDYLRSITSKDRGATLRYYEFRPDDEPVQASCIVKSGLSGTM